MAKVIDIRGLHKSFGSTHALDGLDLEVATGEVHGFLGPNGAGKSTTIRVLLGLLRADAGTVRLLGGDPWRDAAALHRRLAYVPGDVNLWPNLSGGEVIDLLGRLRGGLDEQRRADCSSASSSTRPRRAASYSKGNRQKVALVAALASDVELLVLDEPTSGPRPADGGGLPASCIDEAASAGGTVLLSSHILAEVEALCDRVSIIRAGPQRRERHAGRAAPPHPHLRPRRARPARRAGSTRSPACTTWSSEDHRVRFEVDTATWTRRCGPGAPGHPHLTASRRRWRSCSCVTTATRWTAR